MYPWSLVSNLAGNDVPSKWHSLSQQKKGEEKRKLLKLCKHTEYKNEKFIWNLKYKEFINNVYRTNPVPFFSDSYNLRNVYFVRICNSDNNSKSFDKSQHPLNFFSLNGSLSLFSLNNFQFFVWPLTLNYDYLILSLDIENEEKWVSVSVWNFSSSNPCFVINHSVLK